MQEFYGNQVKIILLTTKYNYILGTFTALSKFSCKNNISVPPILEKDQLQEKHGLILLRSRRVFDHISAGCLN